MRRATRVLDTCGSSSAELVDVKTNRCEWPTYVWPLTADQKILNRMMFKGWRPCTGTHGRLPYIYHGPGDTCSLSLLSLIAMLSYRIVSSVPKIGIQRIVSYRHRTIMTFSVSYRIADLKWIYRIVSYRDRLIVLYRLRTRLSSLIVSCIIVLYWSLFYRATAARWPDGEFIKLSEIIASKPKPYRIVSSWRGYRLLAYRELSPIALIGKYRIVTYRALIVSYRIGRSRAMYNYIYILKYS